MHYPSDLRPMVSSPERRPDRLFLVLVCLSLAVSPSLASGQTDTVPPDPSVVAPLFQERGVIRMRLEADFDALDGDRGEETPERPAVATLIHADGTEEAFEILVRTRGNFRLQRRTCPFPPLRLNFKQGDVEGTLLDSQDKIKLVTHCRDRDRYRQNVVKEYLVYRIYNILTPLSFQARLVRIEYVDTSGENESVERLAIFLEAEEALATRLGGEVMPDEVQERGVHPARIAPEHAIRVNLFEYMVGNTDFSLYGQVGSAPHNVVPVVLPNLSVIPVPYDFDWTGLVNAPYARPASQLGIRSVRQRIYRGLCRDGVDYAPYYAEFLAHRDEITAVVQGEAELEADVREDVVDFLDGFWRTLENPRRARRDIEEACRPY